MGDLTEGLELRCSRCRAVVEACSVCSDPLIVGEVHCARETHHHAHCDAEHRRRLVSALHKRKSTPFPADAPAPSSTR